MGVLLMKLSFCLSECIVCSEEIGGHHSNKMIVIGESHKTAQVYEEGHIKPGIVDSKRKTKPNFFHFKLTRYKKGKTK